MRVIDIAVSLEAQLRVIRFLHSPAYISAGQKYIQEQIQRISTPQIHTSATLNPFQAQLAKRISTTKESQPPTKAVSKIYEAVSFQVRELLYKLSEIEILAPDAKAKTDQILKQLYSLEQNELVCLTLAFIHNQFLPYVSLTEDNNSPLAPLTDLPEFQAPQDTDICRSTSAKDYRTQNRRKEIWTTVSELARDEAPTVKQYKKAIAQLSRHYDILMQYDVYQKSAVLSQLLYNLQSLSDSEAEELIKEIGIIIDKIIKSNSNAEYLHLIMSGMKNIPCKHPNLNRLLRWITQVFDISQKTSQKLSMYLKGLYKHCDNPLAAELIAKIFAILEDPNNKMQIVNIEPVYALYNRPIPQHIPPKNVVNMDITTSQMEQYVARDLSPWCQTHNIAVEYNYVIHGIETDIYFPDYKLNIEIDGPVHTTHRHQRKDRLRDQALANTGIQVRRINITTQQYNHSQKIISFIIDTLTNLDTSITKTSFVS